MRFNHVKQLGLPGCILLLIILPAFHELMAQTKRLEIQKKSSYELKEDTVILDELIMQDSSSLILNRISQTCYIKVNKLKIGKQCWIIGSGVHGTSARPAKMQIYPKVRAIMANPDSMGKTVRPVSAEKILPWK